MSHRDELMRLPILERSSGITFMPWQIPERSSINTFVPLQLLEMKSMNEFAALPFLEGYLQPLRYLLKYPDFLCP